MILFAQNEREPHGTKKQSNALFFKRGRQRTNINAYGLEQFAIKWKIILFIGAVWFVKNDILLNLVGSGGSAKF